MINLNDGHDLLTSYVGSGELRSALEQNLAQPLSLASADFDEDGVPDLVSGYSYNGHGIVTLLRGNVDSIYPNAPEAKQRKADGTFTDAPFLSPAQVFDAPVAADFIGAGDFDADGHWDVVVASRTTKALYLLSGDGRGGFAYPREIALPGVVTAMTTGEVNRADGLTDLVIGVTGERGSQVLAFEGPNGALRAEPEGFELKAAATSLALGQLDNEYTMDLAIAAGNEVLILQGRDRKLSLGETQRAKVPTARFSSRSFDTPVRSIAIGHFTDDDAQSIAVLGDNGGVQVLSQSKPVKRTAAVGKSIGAWQSNVFSSGSWSQAQLVSVHVSSSSHDDLLVVDAANRQLHILNSAAEGTLSNAVSAPSHLAASLDVASAPVAVLPMRLNGDALSDLTVLSSRKSAPAVLPTQPASTFVVTNTNATGNGSLQFAILDANETPGADLITFNIPGTAPFTINQTVPLPSITDQVTIDGTTQPGFAGTPVVAVSGPVNEFLVTVGSCAIRGLAINAGNAGSIRLQGPGGNIVEGNFVGVNFAGTAVSDSGSGEVDVFAPNNTIGGTVAPARNLFSTLKLAMDGTGVGSGNLVRGNYVGTDVTGTMLIAQRTGISVTFVNNNTIGGTVAGARNVIAGQIGSCISISNLSSGNLVQGNYIGTDVTGAVKLATTGGGVSVVSASNTVGGTTPAARNVISGTQSVGINIGGGETHDVLVQGNYIGTNAAGTAVLGNGKSGVEINTSAFNNVIGGLSTGGRNVISGNNEHGVFIKGPLQNQIGNQIQGNYIGTDATGTADFGNTQNGVAITENSPGTMIGGIMTGAGNVISGNGLSGILLDGAQVTGTLVQGNFIGTNAAGTAALGNDLNGVTTSQAPNNTIGGSTAEARNIISASARHGVSIGIDTNSGATGITVRNNYIGTDVSGNNCLGNGRDGVFVNRGSVNHTITDNLITCNGRDGVNIPNFATNDPGIQIQVVQNSIYANAALGIDLGDAGITPNDPGDADTGANFLQNFPVLTSVTLPPAPSEDRTGKPNGPEVTVNINATLNSTPNTAFTVHWYFSSDSQCSTNQQGSRPLVTGRIPGVATDNNGNASFNFPFDFPVGTTNGIINCTATDPQGNTSEFSACLPVNSTPPATVKLSASSYGAAENVGSVSVNVQRTGDTSGVATVNYATSDTSGNSDCNVLHSGVANSRCDYETTAGTLRFAAGETSRTILIPVIDDVYAEGNESFTVTLSSATGALLGSPNVATVTINDNETTTGTNPINVAAFFVRLHYIDFLNREPDASGLAFWSDQITSCADQACIDLRRINVSAAFYVSIEFQETGYLVYRFYKASYGNMPGLPVPVRFNEFLPDTQQIGQGVIIGQPGADQLLENNKVAFAADFVTRSRFSSAFATTLTPAQFVDALFANAGVTPSPTDRTAAISEFGSTVNTADTAARGRALRKVAENSILRQQETNRAFVLMQYFGYLRRNPNDPPETNLNFDGYNFWLGKLNQFNGNFVNAEMVKAFIIAGEYKGRFGP